MGNSQSTSSSKLSSSQLNNLNNLNEAGNNLSKLIKENTSQDTVQLSNSINTLNQLQKNINNKLKNKTQETNKILGSIIGNNKNINSMYEILQIHANTGNENLKKLKDYEIEIATKDKIISNTEKSIENQNNMIGSMVIILIMLFLLIIPLILYILKIISGGTFMGIFVIFIIGGLFYLAWANDYLYVKSFTKNVGSDLYQVGSEVDIDLQNRIKDFNNIVKTDLYGSTEEEWINKNCNCPLDEETNMPVIPTGEGKQIHPQPGFYYDDGTAPQQLIVPRNTYQKSKYQFNEKIDWPNYDQQVNNKNSLIKGQTIYDEVDDRLVGNTTNTRNL